MVQLTPQRSSSTPVLLAFLVISVCGIGFFYGLQDRETPLADNGGFDLSSAQAPKSPAPAKAEGAGKPQDSLSMITGGTDYAPPEKRERRPLNCADPQSIRDFKDVVLGDLGWGSSGNGKGEPDKWARCLCGGAADKAGFNRPAPPEPNSAIAMPACGHEDPQGTLRKHIQWFKTYLPISVEQANTLARCYLAGWCIK